MSEPSGARTRPLTGVRVLDLSTVIAAPLTSMILGDYGAEVIKIEHPRGGDPARTHGPDKDGTALWWLMLSRNKKSVTLYLGDPEGQQILRDLARTADVVVENFRPGVMEDWGLGYAELARENPGLIMAHISGFGRSGSLSREPGFGTIGEVMSGFTFRNGDADGPPMLPPFGLGDGVAGISLAVGIMTALYERTRSGKGQEVDLAIIESLLTIMEPQLVLQDQLGRTLTRTGNQAEMNAPRGLYEGSDGEWVAISASTVSTAARLMHLIGGSALVDEPWFASAHTRRAHAEEIDTVIVPWVGSRTVPEVVTELRTAGVPVAPVYSARDVLDDPQFAAIGSVGTFQDPRLGEVRMPNPLARLSATPATVEWLGPELGQHTDDVLAEIGISAQRRAQLRTRGVV